jgi:hypothetical protein
MGAKYRNTVQIVNPDWPTDYIVIAAEDYRSGQHQLWPEGKVAVPKGKAQPAAQAPQEAPQAASAPDPELPPLPPLPQPGADMAAVAGARLVEVGPQIAVATDRDSLRRLAATDRRSTVQRLVADRLRQLGEA